MRFVWLFVIRSERNCGAAFQVHLPSAVRILIEPVFLKRSHRRIDRLEVFILVAEQDDDFVTGFHDWVLLVANTFRCFEAYHMKGTRILPLSAECHRKSPRGGCRKIRQRSRTFRFSGNGGQIRRQNDHTGRCRTTPTSQRGIPRL